MRSNLMRVTVILMSIIMLFALGSTGFATEVEEIMDVPVIESVEIDIPIISVDVEDIEEVEEVDLGELFVDDFDIMSTGGSGDVTTNLIAPTNSDITITAVTAIKAVVDDVTLYNVKIEYTMPAQAEAPQVTLLGYVFTDSDTFPGTIEDSAIKAIDQITHKELGDGVKEFKGKIDFVLSSAQGIGNDTTLVLMVGTDADLDNADAQVVAIDLSAAIDDEETPTTWEATGATVAPATLSVAADATDATIKAELANAVVTVTGADSKSSDKVEVAWVTTDEIAAGTTVTYTGTVTPAADADWTGSQTVTVTVAIAAAQGGDDNDETVTGGMYGDVLKDGSIDDFDWMTLLNHCLNIAPISELNDNTTAAFKAADVLVDGSVDDFDWMTLLNHCLGLVPNDMIGTDF